MFFFVWWSSDWGTGWRNDGNDSCLRLLVERIRLKGDDMDNVLFIFASGGLGDGDLAGMRSFVGTFEKSGILKLRVGCIFSINIQMFLNKLSR